MHTSPVQVTQLPQHLLIGWVQVTQRLTELGIKIVLDEVDPRWVTELDPAARILHVRADADPAHQLWGLEQARDWLTLGPAASPSARVEPRLRLVLPEQCGDDHPA